MPALVCATRRVRTFVALPLLAFALLAAASVLAPAPDASATAPSRQAARQHKVKHAAAVALRQIGDPYRYGADGPRAFDCSGLLKYSYKKAGLELPRTSSAQARRAHRIPKRQLRRGDLMFFTNGGGVYHAALFLKWRHGRAVMVHSPGSGGHVRRTHPWTTSWFGATVRR